MDKRAIWKGRIQVGGISVPVRLYAAIEDKTIHFRLLHKKDATPVRQEMVHPDTGEPVPAESIRSGYVTEEGETVLLNDAELREIEPEPSRDIEIMALLPAAAVDHRWYDRPYFLGPDGDRDAYFGLAAALDENHEALVRWVMRNREYFGVIRLQQSYPVLITLNYTDEVVQVADLEVPAGRDINQKEFAMAGQLVSAMAGPFDPSQYRDEYREQVMQLIKAKASGKVVKMKKAAPKKPTMNLEKALAGSLKAVGKG